MSGMKFLKHFDKSQLWRLFVDGRFQKKYNGWVGYENKEKNSVQANLNGFEFMLDNFDLSRGLKCTYLRELHKICMLNVHTKNLKSSPGDIRYLNSGMPFFAKSTTYEHLVEVFNMRKDDGTIMFNSQAWGKTANELDVNEIYNVMLRDGKINYRNWYPNLTKKQQDAIEGKYSLRQFYEVKHYVQMQIIERMEDIVNRYNKNIIKAQTMQEKLKVISLVPRELELLHPFPDGNSRTFSCITLTHLLLYHGFPPALLENPNLDNEVSHEQWIKEIEDGMERTLSLLKNPTKSIFNYSILDMNRKDINTFLDMAKNLIDKINDYQEVYLTPKILQRLTNGIWLNANNDMRFTGVGEHNTYKKGHLYFAIDFKKWQEDSINIVNKMNRLINSDIRAFVTDDKELAKRVAYPILLVKDIKKAYTHVAREVRQEVNPKTVLVTGTEGKTGFKTQLYHLLKSQTKVHANINSANTEIPVLRSLINLRADDKVEINEVSVGSDELLRIERTKYVNPDICFFTNIGPNHMDMHKNIDNVIKAKSSVVEGLRDEGVCIVNADMEYYDKLIVEIDKRKEGILKFTYGTGSANDAILLQATFSKQKMGWTIVAEILNERVHYFVPMIQRHIPLSSVGVLLAIKKLGYNIQQAGKEYELLKPYQTMGRLLVLNKKEQGDILFYDQSRRGGLHGMLSAFDDLSRLTPKGKVVALVGGISTKKESDWTRSSHKQLATLINNSSIDRLYLTGDYMQYVEDNLKNSSMLVKHSNDLDELALNLMDDIEPDDLLFIIGNAYLYLGRVADKILKKYKYDYFDYTKPLKNHIKEKLVGSEFLKEFTQDRTQNSIEIFKANILMNFFVNIEKQIIEFYGFKPISDKFVTKGYNQEFCRRWFYNETKNFSKKGKTVFGSYIDYGDNNYLLHIDFATHNMHIGFVRYVIDNGKYRLKKLLEKEYLELKKEHKDLEYRNWGGSWCSVDCGKMIDIRDNKTYKTLTQFDKSDIFKNILTPLLEGLKCK